MSVYLGHGTVPNNQDVQNLEAAIGRRFVGIRRNSSWANGGKNSTLESEYARGVKRAYRNANTEPWTWADVTTGRYDAEIHQFFTDVKATGLWTPDQPYILSIHHEQHVDSGPQPNMGTPSEYPGMFHHIHSIAQSMGVLRVGSGGTKTGFIDLAFVPSIVQFTDPEDEWAAEKIAPDPARYSFVGADSYNRKLEDGSLKRGTSADEVEALHAFALTVGKRYILGEWGCEEHPDKATWMDNYFHRVRDHGSGVGSCYAFYVTNRDDQTTNPDSNPDALAVFKRWANTRHFKRGL